MGGPTTDRFSFKVKAVSVERGPAKPVESIHGGSSSLFATSNIYNKRRSTAYCCSGSDNRLKPLVEVLLKQLISTG